MWTSFTFKCFFYDKIKTKIKLTLHTLKSAPNKKKMIKIKNKKLTSRLQIIVRNQYKYRIKIHFEK